MANIDLIARSWDKLTTTFGNLTHSVNENLLGNSDELLSCLNVLCANNLEQTFIDWYFDEIQEYLCHEIVIPFKEKSKEILLFHYQQLFNLAKKRQEKKYKNRKGNRNRKRKNKILLTLMKESTFDVKLWNDLLCKIDDIINLVSDEISSMKNVIWQLSTLLNAVESLRCHNSTKNTKHGKNRKNGKNGKNGNNKNNGKNENDNFDQESYFGSQKQSIKTMRKREEMAKQLENAHKEQQKQQQEEAQQRMQRGRQGSKEESQKMMTSNLLGPSDTLQTLNKRLQGMIHSIFFSNESEEFNQLFSIMFEYSFIYFTKLDKEYDYENDNDNENEMNRMNKINSIVSDEYVSKFCLICSKLNKLHWLSVLEPIFREICFVYIEYEMISNYQSIHKNNEMKTNRLLLTQSSMLTKFVKWTNMVVLQWLYLIMVHKTPSINVSDTENVMNEYFISPNWMNDGILNSWKMRIEYFVYLKFGSMRMKEIFDIILLFPKSMPSLIDLKQCLNNKNSDKIHASDNNHYHNNNNRHYWRNLQLLMLKSFKQRLLHPGASTKDIVSTYISTIKALRILDPSGVTLEIVGDPIRSYLRGRKDAIRCVAYTLIENDTALLREYKASLLRSNNGNSNNNIHNLDGQKNNKTKNPQKNANREWKEWEQYQSHGNFLLSKHGFDNESDSDASDDDDNNNGDNNNGNGNGSGWEPKRMDSDLINHSKSYFGRECDIVAMLVKIFGSRDLFIQEYQNLLGQRLITMDGMRLRHENENVGMSINNNNGKGEINIYSIEKEMEYLELMKLRFGNDCMHDCEVMIKDVIKSKREFHNLQIQVETQMYNEYLNNNNNNNGDGNNNNNNMNDETKEQISKMSSIFDGIIISEKYWPEMKFFDLEKYSFSAPTKMLSVIFDKYKNTYSDSKQTRFIKFLPFYGCVELELELNGISVELNVFPIQAAIITHIQEQFEIYAAKNNNDINNNNDYLITINDLCKNLKINQSQALENIAFWERKGIVIKENGFGKNNNNYSGYRLANGKIEEGIALNRLMQQKMDYSNNENVNNDNNNNNNNSNINNTGNNNNNNNGMNGDIDKEFEKRVLGTVTQHNPKTADDIFRLLKQLKLHPIFATLQFDQLQIVLDKLVFENKLVFESTSGKYCKPKHILSQK